MRPLFSMSISSLSDNNRSYIMYIFSRTSHFKNSEIWHDLPFDSTISTTTMSSLNPIKNGVGCTARIYLRWLSTWIISVPFILSAATCSRKPNFLIPFLTPSTQVIFCTDFLILILLTSKVVILKIKH